MSDDPQQSRWADHTRRLYAGVTWDWQPLEPLIVDAMTTVSPGKAVRRYERNRDSAAQRKTTDVTKVPPTDPEKIVSGQRSIVNDSVNTLRKGTHIETKKEDGSTYVRRASQVAPDERCDHCGRMAPGVLRLVESPRSEEPQSRPEPVAIPAPAKPSLEAQVADLRREVAELRAQVASNRVRNRYRRQG